MAAIAFLGWGSLCWNPGSLPVVGEWRHGGPTLPLEFSRISMDGRLTIVLDPSGVACETRFVRSASSAVPEAVDALREREGTVRRWIGYHDATGDSSIARFPDQVDVCSTIASWLSDQSDGTSAAIWTALRSNFAEKAREQFSVDAAISYLESLDRHSLDRALEYISRAPPEVQTPVRAAAEAAWRLSG